MKILLVTKKGSLTEVAHAQLKSDLEAAGYIVVATQQNATADIRDVKVEPLPEPSEPKRARRWSIFS